MIVKFITLFIFIHHEVFPVKKKPNFFMFPEGFFPSLCGRAPRARRKLTLSCGRILLLVCRNLMQMAKRSSLKL